MSKIVYIDLDRTIFDYDAMHRNIKTMDTTIKYPQSTVGFFKDLEPLDYALSCIAQIEDAGYEVWFATAPSIKNLHCYTEKAESIKEWFGEEYLDRLIIIPDKSKLIGDYLIDDMPNGKGQDRFKGELLLMANKDEWINITTYLLNKVRACG